jgi:uncharacterized protein YbaR (Trm112 family)
MKAYECLFDPQIRLFDPRRSYNPRGSQTTALLDIVRCPRCRVPLVARMSRGRPDFPCACNIAASAIDQAATPRHDRDAAAHLKTGALP